MLCTAKRENGARLQEKSYLCMMNRYKTHFMVTLLRLRFFLTYFGSFVWMKNGRDHYFMQGAGSPPCANRVVLYDLDFFFFLEIFWRFILKLFPHLVFWCCLMCRSKISNRLGWDLLTVIAHDSYRFHIKLFSEPSGHTLGAWGDHSHHCSGDWAGCLLIKRSVVSLPCSFSLCVKATKGNILNSKLWLIYPSVYVHDR